MFCPKCGTANTDTVRFCRACGIDISLVPVALTGNLPVPTQEQGARPKSRSRSKSKKDHHGPPSIEKAVSELTTGLCFLVISFLVMLYAPAGRIWWFWLLIPAFASLGKGIAQVLRLKYEKPAAAEIDERPITNPLPQQMAPPPSVQALPPHDRWDSVPAPPSVTESTTRELDRHAERLKE